ncbi:MAG: HPr(Ser) kinase/phosphatase [Acidobacteriota bacterium]|nr:HPr(Ser) kinase/phosphatase [Acidobacteriota bacterium]
MKSKKERCGEYLEMLSGFLARPESREPPLFTVADLIEACPGLDFSVLAAEHALTRRISAAKVQLLGLALGGFTDDLDKGSVQILGKAELRFIQERASAEPERFMDPVFRSDIGCFVIPDSNDECIGAGVTRDFLVRADAAGIPVLCSAQSRSGVEARLYRVLEERLAPSLSFHGELVVFRGLGLLIIGPSGIGKSDCALDLIMNGHQLVADDVVHIRRNQLDQLIGKSRELIRDHMDIRGLGIVNVRDLFSSYSIIEEHPVDLVLLLEPWEKKKAYACFNEQGHLDILGIETPMIRVPVSRGRNWINLIHVAVRRFILQSKGYDAETDLSRKLGNLLQEEN